MIKLEHVVLASPEQMKFIIEGMRNPMNSWDKSDSSCGAATRGTNVQWSDDYFIGTNDVYLMQRLANAGTDHRKFISLNTEGHLRMVVHHLNFNREKYLETKDKRFWWQMIQLLPSSYNQTRNVMTNYEVLANIYKSRRGHKLDEWRSFCKWIEALPYSELIMSAGGLDDNSINARKGVSRHIKDKGE